MKKTAAVGALALVTSVVVAPVAMANPSPMWSVAPMQADSCTTAVTAMAEAEKAHRAAVEADEALSAAEQAVAAAFSEVDGFVIGVHDLDSAREIRKEIREKLQKIKEGQEVDEPEETLREKLRVTNRYIQAEETLAEAREAAATDVNETQQALDAARADVERLCQEPEPTTEPTTEPEPGDEPEPTPEVAELIAEMRALECVGDGPSEAFARFQVAADEILNRLPLDDLVGRGQVSDARSERLQELNFCLDVGKEEIPPPEEIIEGKVPFVDLDCKDFPLADGRTAQQILDLTPDDDPFGLDADGDRIACEAGEDTSPATGTDFGDTDAQVTDEEVAVPEGGVATGVGPA